MLYVLSSLLPFSVFTFVVCCINPTLLQSLQKSKALIRSSLKDQLLAVNDEECELLEQRWLSDECAAAIIKFMQRKMK